LSTLFKSESNQLHIKHVLYVIYFASTHKTSYLHTFSIKK